MGLGGFAFALLGCDTTVTDTAEVISLLQRNYDNNLSPAALRGEHQDNVAQLVHLLPIGLCTGSTCPHHKQNVPGC